ncbi:MAG: NAD(P)H-hydrate dehydratase, partial [Methanobacterium sp.]|nr:NAD(P)H-hydrate dehydratase [Methanobacterium sp.]
MSAYAPGLKINHINDSRDLDEFKIKDLDNSVVVDSILGTGIEGKLKEPSRSAIKLINKISGTKIAVDVPSGLNPLNGKIEDLAVKAHYTITFHKAKTGLHLNSEYTGKIRVCDIGIPEQAELFLGKGDFLRIKKRNPDDHKGANGRILVLGGSKDYTGAPALAGLSALNTGADLVYVVCPEIAALPLKSYSPDLIVRGLEGEVINEGMVDDILEMAHKVDCVLMGCGASQDKKTKKAFNSILEKINKPLVMDADALNLVKKDIVKDYEDLIITPHSSEFNAFFREDVDFKVDLEEKIKVLKTITPTIKGAVLLKGKVDLIMQQGEFRLNKTGSPGMTVGGTGDCLAGIVATLRAQGIPIFDAGCLGAFINGLAG